MSLALEWTRGPSRVNNTLAMDSVRDLELSKTYACKFKKYLDVVLIEDSQSVQ